MDCSTPGLHVHHQLPEFTQTHLHWVGDAIQPSHPVVPFSSCPQSLPASEPFPMSQLFAWVGQSIGVSALASFLPKNTQDWSPLGCTGWISLQSKGLKNLPQHHSSKASILWLSAFLVVQLSCPYMTAGKTIALTRWTFVDKVMSLLFNIDIRVMQKKSPSWYFTNVEKSLASISKIHKVLLVRWRSTPFHDQGN